MAVLLSTILQNVAISFYGAGFRFEASFTPKQVPRTISNHCFRIQRAKSHCALFLVIFSSQS